MQFNLKSTFSIVYSKETKIKFTVNLFGKCFKIFIKNRKILYLP